jgi:type IV pilus assembly protein PilA
VNIMKKWFKNAKGLTLVELLAVIVILGIVAAIAVPAIGSTISKSKVNADASTVKLIQDAGYRYAITENISATKTMTVAELVTAGYLQSSPVSQTGASFGNVTITVASGKITVSGGEVVAGSPASPAASPGG